MLVIEQYKNLPTKVYVGVRIGDCRSRVRLAKAELSQVTDKVYVGISTHSTS